MRIDKLQRKGRGWVANVAGVSFSFDPYSVSLPILLREDVKRIFPSTGAVVYQTKSGEWKAFLTRAGAEPVDVSDIVKALIDKSLEILPTYSEKEHTVVGAYVTTSRSTFPYHFVHFYTGFTLLTDSHAVHIGAEETLGADFFSSPKKVLKHTKLLLTRMAESNSSSFYRPTEHQFEDGVTAKVVVRSSQGSRLFSTNKEEYFAVVGDDNAKLIAEPAEDSLIPIYTYHSFENGRHNFIHIIPDAVQKAGREWFVVSHIQYGSDLRLSSVEGSDFFSVDPRIKEEFDRVISTNNPGEVRILQGHNTASYLFGSIADKYLPVGAYVAVKLQGEWYLVVPSQNLLTDTRGKNVGLAKLPVNPDDITHFRNYFSSDKAISDVREYGGDFEIGSSTLVPTNTVFILDKKGKVYAAGKNPRLIGKNEHSIVDVIEERTDEDESLYRVPPSIGTEMEDDPGICTRFQQLELTTPVKKITILERDDHNFPGKIALYHTTEGKVFMAGGETFIPEKYENSELPDIAVFGPNEVRFEGADSVDDILSFYTAESVEKGLAVVDPDLEADDTGYRFIVREKDSVLATGIQGTQENNKQPSIIDDETQLTIQPGKPVQLELTDLFPSLSTSTGKIIASLSPTSLVVRLCR